MLEYMQPHLTEKSSRAMIVTYFMATRYEFPPKDSNLQPSDKESAPSINKPRENMHFSR